MGSSELFVTVGIQDRATVCPAAHYAKDMRPQDGEVSRAPLSRLPPVAASGAGQDSELAARAPPCTPPQLRLGGLLPRGRVLLSSCSEERQVEVTSPSRLLAPWPATRPGTRARPHPYEPAVAPRGARRRGSSSHGSAAPGVAGPRVRPAAPPPCHTPTGPDTGFLGHGTLWSVRCLWSQESLRRNAVRPLRPL